MAPRVEYNLNLVIVFDGVVVGQVWSFIAVKLHRSCISFLLDVHAVSNSVLLVAAVDVADV